jgi:predicted Rossmann-fold nucleotide-binding protein
MPDSVLRPPRIGVFGSAPVDALHAEFCRALGRALRKHPGLVLVTGGYEGFEGQPRSSTDWHLVAGFLEDVEDNLEARLETLLPDPEHDPENMRRFRRGAITILSGKKSQARRFAMVHHVDAFATVKGDQSTEEMIELALALGKPVLPIPFAGDLERQFWSTSRTSLTKVLGLADADRVWLGQVALDNVAVDGVAERVASILVKALKKRCFVIMKYGGVNDAVYKNAILPAIADAGYIAVRADQIPHVGVAVTAVSAAISASDLVVAFVDDPSLNVAYEIGLAHAMNKPVVLVSTDESFLTKMPFDLRHLQVCRAPSSGLRDELYRFIRGVLPRYGEPNG